MIPEDYGPTVPRIEFPNEINNLSTPERLFTLTIVHARMGTEHFFATVNALG
jgi:hypothetical protein